MISASIRGNIVREAETRLGNSEIGRPRSGKLMTPAHGKHTNSIGKIIWSFFLTEPFIKLGVLERRECRIIAAEASLWRLIFGCPTNWDKCSVFYECDIFLLPKVYDDRATTEYNNCHEEGHHRIEAHCGKKSTHSNVPFDILKFTMSFWIDNLISHIIQCSDELLSFSLEFVIKKRLDVISRFLIGTVAVVAVQEPKSPRINFYPNQFLP